MFTKVASVVTTRRTLTPVATAFSPQTLLVVSANLSTTSTRKGMPHVSQILDASAAPSLAPVDARSIRSLRHERWHRSLSRFL